MGEFSSFGEHGQISSQYYYKKKNQKHTKTHTPKTLQQNSRSICMEITGRSALKTWTQTRVEIFSSPRQLSPHFGVSLVRFGRCWDSPAQAQGILQPPALHTSGSSSSEGEADVEGRRRALGR